ncbi:ribonuclease H-like domain-containing protein [Collybia nuda]|uniref:Ribonuclease H-like domain-containing protein n=1 Tax=Collybia nuda TaxID=64659 RepID=A0A9P6CCL8_9AGAR|nr:ribonuclease H-like domain-containing protein [Collybia nuda]
MEHRKITASTRLSDKNNASVPELTLHQQAIAEKRTEERKKAAAKAIQLQEHAPQSPHSQPALPRISMPSRCLVEKSDDHRSRRRKTTHVNETLDESNTIPLPSPARRNRKLSVEEVEDEEGPSRCLSEVNVHTLQSDLDTSDKDNGDTSDIQSHISLPGPSIYEKQGSSGKMKKHQDCKICSILPFPIGSKITLIADCSTIRRHIAFKHKKKYHAWAKANHFESKLAEDVSQRKKERLASEAQQSKLDPHLQMRVPTKRVIPYSDQLFRQAAVEWLIATDQYAEKAQHAFSASKKTTLHLAIPALESLHKAWSTRANSDKYAFFQAALKGAAEKVNEYYEKTNNTDAYIVVMLLDPRMKKSHLLKHWPEELQGEAMDRVEEIFKTRYLKLQSTGSGDSTGSVSAPKRQSLGHKRLRELSDDEDEAIPSPDSDADPMRPWRVEFNGYLNTREAVPEGMETITWWGPNATRYPTWGSLARDHLAIMSSSVSSERAFSQGGITITCGRYVR